VGEMFISRTEKLDICDYCNQQGSVSGGQYTRNSYGEIMIFKCFNCLVKEGKRK